MTIDGVTYGSGTASSKKLAKNKAGKVPAQRTRALSLGLGEPSCSPSCLGQGGVGMPHICLDVFTYFDFSNYIVTGKDSSGVTCMLSDMHAG